MLKKCLNYTTKSHQQGRDGEMFFWEQSKEFVIIVGLNHKSMAFWKQWGLFWTQNDSALVENSIRAPENDVETALAAL